MGLFYLIMNQQSPMMKVALFRSKSVAVLNIRYLNGLFWVEMLD